jgi:hypothetical protein
VNYRSELVWPTEVPAGVKRVTSQVAEPQEDQSKVRKVDDAAAASALEPVTPENSQRPSTPVSSEKEPIMKAVTCQSGEGNKVLAASGNEMQVQGVQAADASTPTPTEVLPVTPSTVVGDGDELSTAGAKRDDDDDDQPAGEAGKPTVVPDPKGKKRKVVDPMVAAIQKCQLTKMTYTAAFASANNLLHDIRSNVTQPAYVWANNPVIVQPVQDALDTVTAKMRGNDAFKAIIGDDVKKLRIEANKKRARDVFDRNIIQFSELMEAPVAALQTETRLLMAAIQARETTKSDMESQAASVLAKAAQKAAGGSGRKGAKKAGSDN